MTIYIKPERQEEGMQNLEQRGILLPSGKVIWGEPGSAVINYDLPGLPQRKVYPENPVTGMSWINFLVDYARSIERFGGPETPRPIRLKRQFISIVTPYEQVPNAGE